MILLSELCYLCLLSQYLFLEFLYLLVVSVSVLLQLLFQGSLHLGEGRREALTPPQALEELIEKEAKRMVRIKSRFPVLHASRLKELMDESKLSQKMNRAELEQVCQPSFM